MPGPFTKNTTVYLSDIKGVSIPKETLDQTWWTSSRKPGKRELDLRAQPFSRAFKHNMSYWQKLGSLGQVVNPPSLGVLTSNEPEILKAYVSLYNQCYGRLFNKINGGNTASLGVTITQWKQSWDMIKLANDRIFSYAKDAAFEAVRRNRNGKRLRKERAADVFLEYQFGWVPALSDVVNSAKILAGLNPPPAWARGAANSTVGFPDRVISASRNESGRVAVLKECLSAKVEVSNPNLWLLNQLGLVNPLTIAWDRVPWSFLVNQFVNVNALLGSFSNDWGLSMTEISDTKTTQLFDSVWMSNGYPTDHPFFAQGRSTAMQRYKSRSVGALTMPTLEVHMPQFSMTSGLIASSLAAQQVRRLRK
jgi:hypothetical protein